MENKISFKKVFNWLKSSEMFARPSKQIPGLWHLIEYYVEADGELQNIKESQLKSENKYWNIEFTNDSSFIHHSNLKVFLVSEIKNGSWNISGNFITLNSSENSGNIVKFQFAIAKNQLRLLKKDAKGGIEFFGFFNRH